MKYFIRNGMVIEYPSGYTDILMFRASLETNLNAMEWELAANPSYCEYYADWITKDRKTLKDIAKALD